MRSFTSDQRGFAIPDWISAIATALALILSIIAFCLTYFKSPKPFAPSVSIGSPVLRKTTVKTPVGDKDILTIVLSMPLTNNGDDAGCVWDVGLRLQSKTLKTQWNYFPAWQINMERYLKTPENKEDLSAPRGPQPSRAQGDLGDAAKKEDPYLAVEAPVSPVTIPGKSTYRQVALFMPRTPDAPQVAPLLVGDLKPCETYVVSLFLLQGDANCQISSASNYKQYASTEFVLTQQHIDALSMGLTVIPLDAPHDKLREQFIGGHDLPCN